MKTGLITFYHIHHYGAALQAAAMERAAESFGGMCEILRYYVNQNNALFRPPLSPGAAASDAHTALHYPALKRRYERFESFKERCLAMTERRYESVEELSRAVLPYDLLLFGSDQIWNPLIFPDRRFDPVFFGAFSAIRKAAYAPSFGLRALPEGMGAELEAYLSGFSHLSVREQAGQNIIRGVCGRDAPVVLDPTLLLTAEEWGAMAAPPEKKGYLLCYCISNPAVLEPHIRAIVRETGLDVVQLCGIRRRIVPHSSLILDAGPAEFLGLFQNAAFVCTNSFHGTVFSLLFHKPFLTAVSPAERGDPENSRTYGLLRRLGLAGRIAGSGETEDALASIDWTSVSRRLEEEREGSLRYLGAALRDEPYQSPPGEVVEESPELASHESCTGCAACRNICPRSAITMKRDQEGFLFPVVDGERCVRCGLCTGACPILHEREAGGAPACYAAWNRDAAVRRESSSGGVFTALADYVLEEGGVVFGAALDGRQRAAHTAVFRKEELWRLRGAKYVQSDTGDTFAMAREALRTRRVLFTGTPCQIDGLYRFLGGRPERLITCDLVCHGVPSPCVWEAEAETLRRERGADIRAVHFRDKSGGWKNPRLAVVYEDGGTVSRPLYATEYGRAFGRNILLRRCCYRCPYASLNRPGDFTLGDFWGLRPEELPEEQALGVSLLLVNTPHASHIFDQLPLTAQLFPIERALEGNPNLSAPSPRPAERDAFFSALALEPFPAVRRKFLTLPPLPLRLASRLLSPELKAKLRGKRQPPEK